MAMAHRKATCSLSRPSLWQHFGPGNSHNHQQIRHATLLRRPKRPYTFTQLVTLSDGSTYVHRTTSPLPVYRSAKDLKNTPLWNPSSQKFMNLEEDEAGRLRLFRKRFGRGWDAEMAPTDEDTEGMASSEDPFSEGSLMDLISEYGQQAEQGDPQEEEKKPASGNVEKGDGGLRK